MAERMTRVNGKRGESMWSDGTTLFYRAGGETHEVAVDAVDTFAALTLEEAREVVGSTEHRVYGAWTRDMPSSGGKTQALVMTGDGQCWAMEFAKSQLTGAHKFARRIKPKEEEEEEEIKIYPAIQTPMGGLMAIGSILCVVAASFSVFLFEQPVVGIILAVAAVVMWVYAR